MLAAAALPKVPPVVIVTAGAAGAFLLYSAVVGRSPLGELRAALTGAPSPGRVAPVASGPAQPSGQPAPAAATAPGVEPVGLVSIGQPGHRLAPAAAAGFAAWVSAFGAPIPVTDSYRSWQVQKAGYDRDPKRFAPPDKSWHVRGFAVDVNLPAVGASPTGTTAQRATWGRLYTAAVATGWCNPRGPYAGDHTEPWHFSFGGCG